MTTNLLSNIRFDQLTLPPAIMQGLQQAGFDYCTKIQAKVLPIALEGRDIAGQAQTGTGKTAAFLITLFSRLLTTAPSDKRKPNQPRALILAPTRELAIQIDRDAELLGDNAGLKRVLVYGGTNYEKQRQSLQSGADLLIGTPGRLIDYFKQGIFDLRAIEVVVLDEADRMFDLGFIRDIRYLLRRMPKPERRLSMLFSATLSWRVMELAYEHMDNPEFIKIDPDKVTADKVRQIVYFPANEDKIPLLLGLLQQHNPARTMIFANTKRMTEKLTAYLTGNGYKTALLSGDVPQRKRQQLLKKFTTGEYPLMVGTDVASRGLHIPDVSHVINFDLPQSEEDYVHRIGRTARAGAEGDAISFACEEYAVQLPEIEAYIGHKIPVGHIDMEILINPKPPAKITSVHAKKRSSGNRRPPSKRSRHEKQRPGKRTQKSDV